MKSRYSLSGVFTRLVELEIRELDLDAFFALALEVVGALYAARIWVRVVGRCYGAVLGVVRRYHHVAAAVC